MARRTTRSRVSPARRFFFLAAVRVSRTHDGVFVDGQIADDDPVELGQRQ
jgi:hypothetical protein